MANKSYSERLKHPKWQEKRLKILKRDKFCCRLCRDNETTLNIHHLEYSNGEPWEIDNKYLITLCEDCHHEIERLKKKCNEFDFKDVRIHKSNDWDDDSMLIFVSHKNYFYFTIYDKNRKLIEGYNIPFRMLSDIRKIISKTLNHVDK